MEKQQFKSFDVIRFKRFTRKSYSVFASMNKAITIGVLSGFTLASAHATSVKDEYNDICRLYSSQKA